MQYDQKGVGDYASNVFLNTTKLAEDIKERGQRRKDTQSNALMRLREQQLRDQLNRQNQVDIENRREKHASGMETRKEKFGAWKLGKQEAMKQGGDDNVETFDEEKIPDVYESYNSQGLHPQIVTHKKGGFFVKAVRPLQNDEKPFKRPDKGANLKGMSQDDGSTPKPKKNFFDRVGDAFNAFNSKQ